jgi:5'-phosphate synthase pdxT subunit
MKKLAGIMALQGDYAKHQKSLKRLGLRTRLVRMPEELEDLSMLVLPGGESTTMSLLLDSTGLREPLRELIASGLPTLATCAGTILLARELRGDNGSRKVQTLGLLDAIVDRNSYGRQVDSFESSVELDWPLLDMSATEPALPAWFIRAPRILSPGPDVQVVGRYEGEIIAVRQGNILAITFHPELSRDTRLHAAVLGFGAVHA